MLTHYLYRHLTKDGELPFYIGIGAFDSRLRPRRAFSNIGRNPIWKKIVLKHGRGGTEIMRLFSSREEANESEKFFIRLYGKKKHGGMLSNIADGGDGMVKGTKLPQWWRDRISAAVRGSNNSRYGKRPSDEQIQKAIAAIKGTKRTPEQKAAVSRAQKGIPNPPEQVRRHTEWLKSDQNPMRGANHWKSRPVIDTSTNRIFSCVREASKFTGINYGTLISKLKGVLKNNTPFQFYDGLHTTS